MNRRIRKAVLIGALAGLWLLGIASGAGCAGETVQPADPTTTTPPMITTTAPITTTPLATASGEGRTIATAPSGLPEDLGWRVIIRGPSSADQGDEVTYEIRCECVREGLPCQQLSLEYGWTEAAASLVEASPKGGVGIDGHGLAWAMNEDRVIRVVLRIADGFHGDLHMGVYTRGSGITYSEGSVDQLTTSIP